MPIVKKDKAKIIENKLSEFNDKLNHYSLSDSLKINIATIKELFANDDTLILREVENNWNNSLQYCLIYCNGLVNSTIINENIIKPLILAKDVERDPDLVNELVKHVILINEVKTTKSIRDIVENVTYGDVVLFIDGYDEALVLNAKYFESRAISEPESEKILTGPREGFTESLLVNLSMIRRKLRTNDLKLKYFSFGDKTKTQACVCYMDSIVNKTVLAELYKRLKEIKIDGVIDTNYIMELTRDNRFSPFRTTGYTERPDSIVGKLLEGHIAFILDGTPVVLTLPYFFIESFQNGEDYYLSFYYTSFARILRILGFIFTVMIPAFYIAVVAFHHEILPTPLFINIAIERQSAPLPAAVEAIIMLMIFDILRETGIRMPTHIGQALSIVGALVIGQAAVTAKLVAAPMVIIVAFTGITGLLVPKLNSPIIFLRAFFLLLASMFGLFGLMIGISFLIVHILNLKSFGLYQVNITGNLKYQSLKDTILRAPWWQMIKRPRLLSNNQIRLKKIGAK